MQSEKFKDFIRESNNIVQLYEELLDRNLGGNFRAWKAYDGFWNLLHVGGAIAFVWMVTAAVVINDIAEMEVLWITLFFFTTFGLSGYLTGQYLPVLHFFRGWILLWNPFLREPLYMLKLQIVSHAIVSLFVLHKKHFKLHCVSERTQ